MSFLGETLNLSISGSASLGVEGSASRSKFGEIVGKISNI